MKENKKITREEIKRRQKQRRTMQIITRTFFAALILVAGICIVIKSTNPSSSSTLNTVKIYHAVEVKSGDTLESICEEYMDRIHYSSSQKYIDEVKQINNLPDDTIIEGNDIIVPIFVYQSM